MPDTVPIVPVHARALRLQHLSLALVCGEAAAGLWIARSTGSTAVLSFGLDSLIELASAAASLWYISKYADPHARAHAEQRTLVTIGALFVALAGFILLDASAALVERRHPEDGAAAILLASVTGGTMLWLARQKQRLAEILGSHALAADAVQSRVCALLSLLLLLGVAANHLTAWWWVDAVTALAMVPLVLREGIAALRGEAHSH